MTDLRTPTSASEPRSESASGEGATPSGVLVAQRGLFTGPVREVPDELYAEILAGRVVCHRRSVRVEPFSRLSTNTYFGRFPASFWQRWTRIGEVIVRGRVEGSGRVLLRASDIDGVPRTVSVHEAGSGEFALTAALDRFVDGGGLWLEVATDDSTLALHDVRWTADGAATRTLEVVICTHNRVNDCLATLRALGDEPDALEVVSRVTVVDQGDDPLESCDAFATVHDHLRDRFRYVRQANLGGSGGFTRGLMEAVENGNAAVGTDVLLMDDDVRLEPEVVVRLAAFARCTTQPLIAGAQMLNLLHPTQLLAGAEHAVLSELAIGRPVGGAAFNTDVTAPHSEDMDDREDESDPQRLARRRRRQVRRQDRRIEAGYNGWWTCLIPTEVVRTLGYPLPLFLQWDDVEYSVRAWGAGIPVVTLPGAAIWHADFQWKDRDDWSRYFEVRNSMIAAALHSSFQLRPIVGVLGDRITQCLVGMNYGLAATMIAAVEGFLAGPSELDDGGVAVVARLRELRRRHPETVVRPAAEVPTAAAAVGVVPSDPKPPRPGLVKARRLLQHARGRHKLPDGQIGAEESGWWHASRFARVAVTDAGQGGVHLREYDSARFRSIGRDSARVLWRLMREGPCAAEQWRAAVPRLTSGENWKRLFETSTRR